MMTAVVSKEGTEGTNRAQGTKGKQDNSSKVKGGPIVQDFGDNFEDYWRPPRHDGRSSRRKANGRKPLMQQQRLKNQRRCDIADSARDFHESPW
jgi:hypothetical protein